MSTTADRLRAAKEARGQTWQQVQERSGVSRRTLMRVLGGSHKGGARLDTLRSLARATGVPLGELLDLGEPLDDE